MPYDKVVDSAALDAALVGIADAIRGKTGGTGKLTIDQMAAAIAGITAGGGGGGLAYDGGEFTLTADTEGHKTSVPALIPHALGAKPDFICVWTDDLVGVPNPDSTHASQVGQLWLNDWMGLENWGSSTAKFPGTTILMQQGKGQTDMFITKPNSSSYTIDVGDVTMDDFPLCYYRNAFWRAGLTYKYFVCQAWWNVGGVANAD